MYANVTQRDLRARKRRQGLQLGAALMALELVKACLERVGSWQDLPGQVFTPVYSQMEHLYSLISKTDFPNMFTKFSTEFQQIFSEFLGTL